MFSDNQFETIHPNHIYNLGSSQYTSLTKEDVRRIYKEFGMRTYDHMSGGEPPSITESIDGALGLTEKTDMIGWFKNDLNDDQYSKVKDILKHAELI